MKKLNNKGFAIASILYSIMVLFLMLLLCILGILGSRKATLDKNKKDILESLNKDVTTNRINFRHRNITIINSGNTDDIVFALNQGVSAVDENGNSIDASNIAYDLNVNNIENKDYIVTYTVNSSGKKITNTRKVTFIAEEDVKNFTTKGSFTASQNGAYKLEAWGASGGSVTGFKGGAGGYATGFLELNKGEKLYIEVGGTGVGATTSGENLNGGYNGGGSVIGDANLTHINASGGGATHISTTDKGELKNYADYKSEILIVAGGGGGAKNLSNHSADTRWGNGGAGGGLNGIGASSSNGSTTSYTVMSSLAGKDRNGYKFGEGESVIGESAGGGGWYGGYGGALIGTDYAGAGSGGSGFINNSVVLNGLMYAGNEAIDGVNPVGNIGNGKAKISLVYYY